jgi:hypothetical protein
MRERLQIVIWKDEYDNLQAELEALRKVAEAAKHWQKCKLAESDFPPTEQLVLIQRNTRDAEQGLMFAIAALRELESE